MQQTDAQSQAHHFQCRLLFLSWQIPLVGVSWNSHYREPAL